jgi:hypothetical protein
MQQAARRSKEAGEYTGFDIGVGHAGNTRCGEEILRSSE